MHSKSLIELTNLCVLTDGERILVEERMWRGENGIVFPGGHVEQGESLLAAVKREMKEETGLDIENPVPCGYKDWIEEDGTRYLVLLYKADRFSGKLRSSEEGRVFWVTREEFGNLNVIWEMRDVLKIVDSNEYSELFYEKDSSCGQLLG